MSKEYVNEIAPEHDRLNCSDRCLTNAAVDEYDAMGMGRCYRCTLLKAAAPAPAEDLTGE